MRKIFLKGLSTGLILQLAIGPVFIFIANIVFQEGILNGLAAVLAVTCVDYIYIFLAIMGVGKVLEKKRVKTIFIGVSSIILMIFGALMIQKGMMYITPNTSLDRVNSGLIQSFSAAFVLTISSPLTIVFWTSVFTAKTIEYSMDKKELRSFGVAAGLATFLFLGGCVVILSLMKTMVPEVIIQVFNIVVGMLLISYGLLRIGKNIKIKKNKEI